MPRKTLGRLLVVVGAILCIPGAIAIIVFVQGVTVVDAFQAARPCEVPSRDAHADCLSLFDGRITGIASAGRSNEDATIDLEDTTVTVRYSGPTTLRQGSNVVTEWWRGKLVALGIQGTSPNVITNQSPVQNLETYAFAIGLVIPAISALVAGLLVLQSPMSADELITSSLARWPDPPRPVDRVLAWRVAWGGQITWVAFFVWAFLYVFPGLIVVLTTGQPLYAPFILVGTFVLSFGLTESGAAAYLSEVVRSSAKRTIVVQKLEQGFGRSRNNPKIWYALNDGRIATSSLDSVWRGRINEGDRLDALTDPKSGTILRLLSTPPS